MTLSTAGVAPRSTASHCGSEKALAQRVPVLPSVALEAGVPGPSTEDAVVGLPWESRESAACADGATTVKAAKLRASSSRNAPCTERGRGLLRSVPPEVSAVMIRETRRNRHSV